VVDDVFAFFTFVMSKNHFMGGCDEVLLNGLSAKKTLCNKFLFKVFDSPLSDKSTIGNYMHATTQEPDVKSKWKKSSKFCVYHNIDASSIKF